MEKTVYYLCKETLRMSETGEVAFTKGLFYKLNDKYERFEGEVVYQYTDDLGKPHTLTKDFKKTHMVKVRDKVVLRMLTGKSISLLAGTYFICVKTMKMRVTGETALKKGKVYKVDELLNQVDSDYLKAHQMSARGMEKYLVKIIDKSVLGEQ